MAQKELLEIIESNPKLPQVWAALASTYTWEAIYGRSKSSIVYFGKASEATRKALSLNNNDVNALASAAVLSLMKKEHENAINYIKKAISVQPSAANCYVIYGSILNYMGRPNEAILFIERGILLNPFPYHWVYSALGRAYADNDEYEEAIKALNKSNQIKANSIAYALLAAIYSQLGYEIEAKKAAAELLLILPDFSIEKVAKSSPYKNRNHITFRAEALRQAGLPD